MAPSTTRPSPVALLAASMLLLIGVTLHAPGVAAGGYGKAHRHLKRVIKDEERYHPSWKAAPVLREDQLPKQFLWSDVEGKNMLTPSWQQHTPKYCGSCFLHATLSMLQDRLKIRKGGKAPDVMLGRQSFLNCAPQLGYSQGCNGGDVIDVIEWMHKHGLPDEGCVPYAATDYRALGLGKHDKCPPIHHCANCMPDEKHPKRDDCWPVTHPTTYYVSSWGNVGDTKPSPDNVPAMMSEIYLRGPITCSISCPDKFVWDYDGKVFVDQTNDTDVDHDIEVVGWGEEDGKPYWLIRNSWGQFWGLNGFAKIFRGNNSQQIEAGDCWAAEITWQDEQDVDDGVLIGSMYGLRRADGGDDEDEDQDDAGVGRLVVAGKAGASIKQGEKKGLVVV